MKFANANDICASTNNIALTGSEIHITDVNLRDTLPRLRFFKDRLRSRVQNDPNGLDVTRERLVDVIDKIFGGKGFKVG